MVRELTSKVFRKSPMSAGATGELPRPRERRAGVGDQRPLTRVVVIANIYAPYRVPTLRELGRSVDLRILFSAATEPNRDWAVPDRMPFRSEVIGGRVVGRGRSEPLYVSLKLFRRLRALNPDVVIVGGYSMPAVYAAFYCRLRGRPLILWSEGTPASESALGGHQNVARSVLTRAASGAVAASTDARDRFAELGVPMDRIFVAPYALDVGERPYRHFDKTAPVQLLFVAQLIPRKGLSRLLRALALPSLSELHLTVAGSGPDRDALETMARSLNLGERVRFLGFVAQENLSALYARHDLFVFPTLEDTFGMVTLEAMAAGLPVIASSRAGSTRDFVREGENGWICDPAPDSIAAALERALRQRAAWPAVGQRNREAVETASPEASARQLGAAVSRALVG